MKRLFNFTEQFFWTIVWVFLALIAGYAILSFIQSRESGNFVGNAAGFVISKSEPN